MLLLWVLKCLYFCILKQKAKSYYTFKLKELISVFLKLIESRQTKIGWDYLCVKFLNCGITNVCVPPSWGGAPWVQNLPTSGHKSILHCRKTAVTENCCSWRGLNKPTPPLQCYTNWGSVCWRECSSTCRFLLLFLWFTVTLFWKKNCYLTLYLTSKLLLVVVSSAMFIFHQIMFVSNVCKS